MPYYSLRKVSGSQKAFSYALRGIVAFSTVPLVVTSILGIVICAAAFIFTVYVLIEQLILQNAVPGYASLMCIILFGFGINFLVLGIIGQYLAQMYLEIKHRPKYIVRESSISNADQ